MSQNNSDLDFKHLSEQILRSERIEGNSCRINFKSFASSFKGYRSIILDDELSVKTRRLAQIRYLDYPNTKRGKTSIAVEGFDEFHLRKAVDFINFEVRRIIKTEFVFIFFEPWLTRGSILVEFDWLIENYSIAIRYSDFDLTIYSSCLNHSMIQNSSNNDRFVISICAA